MALLEIENLDAGYGNLAVLHGVSLHVDQGEFVVLIGPNGAGKSTILKSIYGLTNQTAGRIQFQGRTINHLPTHALIETGIGFVPQGRLVFSTLSVEENLCMGGYLLDQKETLKLNLERVYEQFPVLFDKKSADAGTLSGGQQQQLAIGRSLMMSPSLLMLDEPSLGLSPKLMHEVFAALEDLRKDGMTILVVEQNVHLALQYVDRGYLLAAGKIKHTATAEQFCATDFMKRVYLT